MNIRLTLVSMLMLACMLTPVAHSEPPTSVQIEVNFLLGYVDGNWHDSKMAQTHLRDKYKYLSARNQITTTEDFIEKAATKSSFTGHPYEVRCGSGVIMSSNQWLHAELARFRTF
jgi:Family of unknown function (DUF5329)